VKTGIVHVNGRSVGDQASLAAAEASAAQSLGQLKILEHSLQNCHFKPFLAKDDFPSRDAAHIHLIVHEPICATCRSIMP
jgi:hypothetical protein